MSTIEVKVGQVWRDKDKRRNTVIEIISVDGGETWGSAMYEATGLVVGTEEERVYQIERLVKRWEIVQEKAIDKEIRETLTRKAKRTKKTPKPIHETREAWLEEAVKLVTKKVFRPV